MEKRSVFCCHSKSGKKHWTPCKCDDEIHDTDIEKKLNLLTNSETKNPVKVIDIKSPEKITVNNSPKDTQKLSTSKNTINKIISPDKPVQKEKLSESDKKVEKSFFERKNSNSGVNHGLFTIDKGIFKKEFTVENENNSFASLKRLISVNSNTVNADTAESEHNTVANTNQIFTLTKKNSNVSKSINTDKAESVQEINSKNTSKSIRPISIGTMSNFNGIFSDTNSNNHKDVYSVLQMNAAAEKYTKTSNEVLQVSNGQKLNYEKQEILSGSQDEEFNIDAFYDLIDEGYTNKENCAKSEKNCQGVGIQSKKISKNHNHDAHPIKQKSMNDKSGNITYNTYNMKPSPKCKQKTIYRQNEAKFNTNTQDENINCTNIQHHLLKKPDVKSNILEEKTENIKKTIQNQNQNERPQYSNNEVQNRVFTTPSNINKASNSKQCIISYKNGEDNQYQTKMLTLLGFDDKIKQKIQAMKERKDKFYKRFFPEGSRASSNAQKKTETPKPIDSQRSQAT